MAYGVDESHNFEAGVQFSPFFQQVDKIVPINSLLPLFFSVIYTYILVGSGDDIARHTKMLSETFVPGHLIIPIHQTCSRPLS